MNSVISWVNSRIFAESVYLYGRKQCATRHRNRIGLVRFSTRSKTSLLVFPEKSLFPRYIMGRGSVSIRTRLRTRCGNQRLCNLTHQAILLLAREREREREEPMNIPAGLPLYLKKILYCTCNPNLHRCYQAQTQCTPTHVIIKFDWHMQFDWLTMS